MATEKRMIDANYLMKAIRERTTGSGDNFDIIMTHLYGIVEAIPTVDAVEVVFCDDCVKHGGCYTEDVFRLARIEKPYCCAGKMNGDGNGT